MKLGARILKTGIAIILAVSVAALLPSDAGMITVAGIAAVVAMQPSVYRTFKTIVDQFQGNIIGALLAMIMVTIFGNNIIIMGVTVILLIALLYKMNIAHVATLATVTALIIMGQHDGSFYISAFYRFTLVMIGVISSFIVNLTFLPPKFETKIYYNSLNISTDIFKWFNLVLNDATEFNHVKNDLELLRQRIVNLEQLLEYYKEERLLTKKQMHALTRKKILFKEIVLATRDAYDVLKRMNRYQNDMLHLSDTLLLQVKLEIDELTQFHEQILISITKKAKFNLPEAKAQIANPLKRDIIEVFQDEVSQHNVERTYSYRNVMHVISSLEEYRYNLEHLNRLSISYFKYHANDPDIDIVEEDFDL
ncbi:aromatic acid exporter family protein [Staphylococcus sp. 17KM0847]|uniref:aromatic acid exporter family protein n=1 Tax=Staphylococcus sp. 17KM0847 TaxID=2583989 RepID=UPI0015DBD8CE|nr:aromatic acid exporter family protein [Staphylococcus sp. 17KM0847]QLK86365.1 aromatic acid exporter family protein [Staphylococcus sp. 17KM0847]